MLEHWTEIPVNSMNAFYLFIQSIHIDISCMQLQITLGKCILLCFLLPTLLISLGLYALLQYILASWWLQSWPLSLVRPAKLWLGGGIKCCSPKEMVIYISRFEVPLKMSLPCFHFSYCFYGTSELMKINEESE